MQKKCRIDEAMKRKYPEQVVLVTTRSAKGRENVMAVGWTCIVSGDPLMLALGIDDESYSYELIRATRRFVVAFPGERMSREVLFAGTRHGHKMDKLRESGLKVQKASVVSASLLADAVVNLECRLVDVYRPGDCPVVIGKVVAAHQNRDTRLKRLYTVGQNYAMGKVRSTILKKR